MSKLQRSSGGAARPLVSVLTPTVPIRAAYLAECRASVLAQTTGAWEHLRIVDEEGLGCAAVMNQLADAARGQWLFPLADDDLLLPGCLDTLLAASADADVVYSPPLVWGRDPAGYQLAPPIIPAPALISRELWQRLGGYDTEWNREEDRRLWIRALAAGARFVRVVSEPTWVYRFHTGNKSLNGGVVPGAQVRVPA